MSEHSRDRALRDKASAAQDSESRPARRAAMAPHPLPAAAVRRFVGDPRGAGPDVLLQLSRTAGNRAVARRIAAARNPRGLPESVAEPASGNPTRLPPRLRMGIESLSGLAMDDVRVHYDSPTPAGVGALAFAQGHRIHLAPGQEAHLAHEAWHVVQQKLQRVRPTRSVGGNAVNDQDVLEKEAHVMGRRAIQVGGSGRSTPSERLAVVPVADQAAPIQRVKWRWNAGTKTWSQVGPNTTAAPPAHEGSEDGEEWDDTYSQATDPTVRPFLPTGARFMGERAMRQQLQGKRPAAADVRVSAFKTANLRGGSGLHEVVPTNLAGEVAASGNPAMIGAQSGARTSTAHQLFRTAGGEVGAHTGFAPKASGPGSTHTAGQAAAHDRLRLAARAVMADPDPARVVNAVVLANVEGEPTGQEVLASAYLTGMQPNLQAIGRPIGPPAIASTPPDPARLELAKAMHESRELTKTRIRSLKRNRGQGRSPSPSRAPIDASGGGGGYVAGPPSDYRLSPVPSFESGSVEEEAANMAAWLTAAEREGFKKRRRRPNP